MPRRGGGGAAGGRGRGGHADPAAAMGMTEKELTKMLAEQLKLQEAAAAAQHKKAKDVEDDDEEEEDEEEEFDLIGAMNAMSVDERRKVYALKGLFRDFQALRAKYVEELNALMLERLINSEKLAEKRNAIINGEVDLTEEEKAALKTTQSGVEEVEDEDAKPKKAGGVKFTTPQDEKVQDANEKAADSQKGGIPNFWATVLKNHEYVGDLVTDRDMAVLAHLRNITKEYIEGNPSNGYNLHFHFDENEYMSDKLLTKTYKMEYDEDDGDLGYTDIEGCEIHWTSPEKNPTVILKQKKQRHKSGKGFRVVQREEKCDSFFNFFTAPGDNDEEEDDEDDMFLQQDLEQDSEIGEALANSVVPFPAQYYAGRSIDKLAKALREQMGAFFQPGMEDDEDYDEEEEDEEEDDEEIPMPRGRGGRGRAAGGRGGAPQGGAAPECKQQ